MSSISSFIQNEFAIFGPFFLLLAVVLILFASLFCKVTLPTVVSALPLPFHPASFLMKLWYQKGFSDLKTRLAVWKIVLNGE